MGQTTSRIPGSNKRAIMPLVLEQAIRLGGCAFEQSTTHRSKRQFTVVSTGDWLLRFPMEVKQIKQIGFSIGIRRVHEAVVDTVREYLAQLFDNREVQVSRT